MPSPALLARWSRRFVAATERFVKDERSTCSGSSVASVRRTVHRTTCGRSSATEGVLFVGNAQEKLRVARTDRCRNANSDSTYP